MNEYNSHLETLDPLKEEMVETLTQWVNINSGSYNPDGLKKMATVLQEAFNFGDDIELIQVPLVSKITMSGAKQDFPQGQALRIRKRVHAEKSVFLSGHMDTVFSQDSSFQSVEELGINTLRGPGITDMKGGLLVMLYALKALENSPYAESLGWEVLITPDEEIGSPASRSLIKEYAKKHTFGIVFESARDCGSLVRNRKGTADYIVIAKGVSAHSGKDFFKGKNAIAAIAEVIKDIQTFNHPNGEVTYNVGMVEGGMAKNIVPDFASCSLEVRMQKANQVKAIEAKLKALARLVTVNTGVEITMHGGLSRFPRVPDSASETLFDQTQRCAKDLGFDLGWIHTGGGSDGNLLAEIGLPHLDGMGVQGGGIHSPDEFVTVSSILERTKLTTLLLMKYASGELTLDSTGACYANAH